MARRCLRPALGLLLVGAGPPRRNQVVLVRGRRIEAVDDAAKVKVPEGAAVIDLSNATVLPGLIDSHTHIFLFKNEPSR